MKKPLLAALFAASLSAPVLSQAPAVTSTDLKSVGDGSIFADTAAPGSFWKLFSTVDGRMKLAAAGVSPSAVTSLSFTDFKGASRTMTVANGRILLK